MAFARACTVGNSGRFGGASGMGAPRWNSDEMGSVSGTLVSASPRYESTPCLRSAMRAGRRLLVAALGLLVDLRIQALSAGRDR